MSETDGFFELPNEDDCESEIESSDAQVGGAISSEPEEPAGDGGEPIPNPPHGPK